MKYYYCIILCFSVVFCNAANIPGESAHGPLGTVPEGYTSFYRDDQKTDTYYYCYNPDVPSDEMNSVFYGVTGNEIYTQDFRGYLYINDQITISRYGYGDQYTIPVIGIADYSCYGMKNMNSGYGGTRFPRFLKWIGQYSFYNCELIDFKFDLCSNSLESIGKYAFQNCSGLKFLSLYSHENLTRIETGAFADCKNLLQIDFPKNLKKIEESICIHNTSLEFIHYGNQVDSICEWAFYGCASLESINLPETLKFIGDGAFANCALKNNLVIPDNVERIENRVFDGNEISSVTIGKNVKFIGNQTFYRNNHSIKRVIVKSEIPPMADVVFSDYAYSESTLYVPSGTRAAYSTGEHCWKYFNNIIEYDEEYIPATEIIGQCESYQIMKGAYDPLVLAPGTTHKLTATVEPENATDKSVYWEVGNEDIARISDGTIEMLQEGKTTLRMYNYDGISYSIPLICGQPVTEIKIPSELIVCIDSPTTLRTEVLPDNCGSAKVRYQSDNTSIAEVNNEGKITGIQPGTAKITVEALDGSGVTAQCVVTVRNPLIQKITLNYKNWTNPCTDSGSKYDTLQLIATVYPSNAEKDIIWSASDENIASVDSDGLVSFNGFGYVKIRATSKENADIFSECNISVEYEVNFEINGRIVSEPVYLTNIDQNKLNIRLKPASLPAEDISFSEYIYDQYHYPDICATISDDGDIDIIQSGSGHIYLTYSLYGQERNQSSSTIYLSKYITSLEFEKSEIEIKQYETVTLNLRYTPEGTSDEITWTSSDIDIVTVDKNGTISALSPGVVTITARTKYRSAECIVTVKPAGSLIEDAEVRKTEVGRYDLIGKAVSEDYRGFVIVRYSDGSNSKTIQR